MNRVIGFMLSGTIGGSSRSAALCSVVPELAAGDVWCAICPSTLRCFVGALLLIVFVIILFPPWRWRMNRRINLLVRESDGEFRVDLRLAAQGHPRYLPHIDPAVDEIVAMATRGQVTAAMNPLKPSSISRTSPGGSLSLNIQTAFATQTPYDKCLHEIAHLVVAKAEQSACGRDIFREKAEGTLSDEDMLFFENETRLIAPPRSVPAKLISGLEWAILRAYYRYPWMTVLLGALALVAWVVIWS